MPAGTRQRSNTARSEGYTLQMQQFDATDLGPKLIAASWEKNRQWQRQIDGLFSTIGERLQGHDHT